jgi:GR25 family glycosyltransferase involved in LPS biosynthesis
MKAFVIYLPTHSHSVASSDQVLSKLKSYNIDATLFEGVDGEQASALIKKESKSLYPYGIKNHELSRDELLELIRPEMQSTFLEQYYGKIYKRIEIGKQFQEKMSSPGVIGCFYSHYGLWKKCVELNEPIMIFEDDVKFYRSFEPVDWEDVLILALGKTTYLNEPYKNYLENPIGNPQVINWRNHSMPGCVGYAIKPHAAKKLVKFWRPYWTPADNAINNSLCRIQMSTYQMGRTTLSEEGNVSSIKMKDQ